MRTNGKQGKRLLAMLGVSSLGIVAVTCLCAMFRPAEEKPAKSALEMPPRLFRDWTQPDVALVLSAEQHGYLLPCGCSKPQVGGLERRYNFLQLLRGKGWPMAAVDLGDIPQKQGPRQLPNVQGMLKYRFSMEALKQMGYLAVGLGEHDASLSLFNLLGEYALNNPSPAVVSANLHDADTLYPEQVKSYVVEAVKGSRLKVGVSSVIGPTVGEKSKTNKVELDENRQAIPKLLAGLAKDGANLNVLLYQGSIDEAKKFAGEYAQFHVIVCLSAESEPSSEPARVGETFITSIGWKGRYVGVVGVYATGKPAKPFDYRFQLVSLSEEFLTPEGEQAKQPILNLMEQYTKELKSGDYLAKYGPMKHPSQVAIPGAVPSYAGTEKCRKCHETAFDVWENSKHAKAFASLEKAKQPSLRHFDAECIVCHTVGFGYETGYQSETKTAHLKNVGCESCHGPASEHVKKPKDDRWHAVLNPWRPGKNETALEKEQRHLRTDLFCQQCHDIDNDVHYKFKERWPAVAHPTPSE